MLILIRGIPGSGKTVLARTLLNAGFADEHFENDDFFYDGSGNYQYDGAKIKSAVGACLRKTEAAIGAGKRVIVANTFTQRWEANEYRKIAERFNVPIQVIETWANFDSEHDVPNTTMIKMYNRFESGKEFHNYLTDNQVSKLQFGWLP